MTALAPRARRHAARLISDASANYSPAPDAGVEAEVDDALGDELADRDEVEVGFLTPGREKLTPPEPAERQVWIDGLDQAAWRVLEGGLLDLTLFRASRDARRRETGIPLTDPEEGDLRDRYAVTDCLEVKRARRKAYARIKAAAAIYRASKAAASCRVHNVRGGCPLGHAVAAILSCGRAGCGCAALNDERTDDRGPILSRRMRRAAPKLEWCQVWAYLVVTVPTECRSRFRSREGLAELHRISAAVMRVLRPDSAGSLTCNHEFGDRDPSWKPHGNAIAPLPPGARWKVSKGRLRMARAELARLLGIEEGRANLYYAYVPEKKRDHLLRYVLRDTSFPHRGKIADQDLEVLFGELRGFRRVRYHGNLSDRKWGAFAESEEVKAGRAAFGMLDPAAELAREIERGKCPACEDALEWKHSKEPLLEGEWVEVCRHEFYLSLATWEALQAREPNREGESPP